VPTFVDNFDRADGALQAPWILHDGDGPTIPNVVSNQAGGTLGGAYYSGFFMQGAQQSVSVDVPVRPTSYLSLSLCVASPTTGYYGYWSPSGGASGTFEIYIFNGTFGAPLDSTSGNIAAGQNYRFERVGQTLSQYVDGVLIQAYTDASNTFSTGYAAFGTEDTTARVDNFTATFTGGVPLPLLTRRRR
jgi:hypothetical protein